MGILAVENVENRQIMKKWRELVVLLHVLHGYSYTTLSTLYTFYTANTNYTPNSSCITGSFSNSFFMPSISSCSVFSELYSHTVPAMSRPLLK